MGNPLLNMFGSMSNGGNSSKLADLANMIGGKPDMNNPLAMLTKFNKLKNSISAKDGEAMINEMLKSGEINQDQLNQAKEIYNQFKGLLK